MGQANVQLLESGQADLRVKFASIGPAGNIVGDAQENEEYRKVFESLPEDWNSDAVGFVQTRSEGQRPAWVLSSGSTSIGAVGHETGVEFLVAVGASVSAEAIIALVKSLWEKWNDIRCDNGVHRAGKNPTALVVERNDYGDEIHRFPTGLSAEQIGDRLQRFFPSRTANVPDAFLCWIMTLVGVASACLMVGFIWLLAATPVSSPQQISHTQDATRATSFVWMISAMFFAGTTGAALCNLRGLFEHTRHGSFVRQRLEQPYYLRPFMGGLGGVLSYFMIRGGLLAFTGQGNDPTPQLNIRAAIPLAAIGLLAGFASKEFMVKLKQLAETLFGSEPED